MKQLDRNDKLFGVDQQMPIPDDLKSYTVGEKAYDYPDDRWGYTLKLRETLGDKMFKEPRWKPSPQVRPTLSRNAFPISSGYATYSKDDERTFKFFVDLYNGLVDIGLEDTKLLVNPAACVPLVPDQIYNPLYLIRKDLFKDVGECRPYIGRLFSYSVRHVSSGDIVLRAKKSSSPGFPRTLVDGTPYTAKDVTYGVKGGESLFFYGDPKLRLSRNYLNVKKGWNSILPDLASKIVSDLDDGVTIGNVFRLCTSLEIATYPMGNRGNSIDAMINVPAHEKLKYSKDLRVFGKNRIYSNMDGRRVTCGKVNMEKWCDYTAHYFPTGFGPHRLRPICSCPYPTESVYQVPAQRLLRGVEDSKFGFIGDREEVKDRYQRFCDASLGDNWLFAHGDRSNSEVTVTTNWDSFKGLVPVGLERLFEMATTGIKLTKEGPLFNQGLISGMAFTTLVNVMAGFYELCHKLASISQRHVVDVGEAICSCMEQDRDWAVIGPFNVFWGLPTDDIPFVIRSNVPLDSSKISQDEERLMGYELSNDHLGGVFGMYLGKQGMHADGAAQISKLFFIERPGYRAHDAWSVMSRMTLVPEEVKRLSNNLLTKYFDTNLSLLEAMSKKFLADLYTLGLTPADVLNEFSPKDQILLQNSTFATVFGGYVEKSTLVDPTRVPQDIVDQIYKSFDPIFNRAFGTK